MQVKDAMTTTVYSVEPNAPVAEITKILMEHNISGVPVVDENSRVIGVVSEGDLMQRAKSTSRVSFWRSLFTDPTAGAEAFIKEHGLTAGELMTQPPICATEDLPLGDAVAIMQRQKVNRLPVVRDGALVGLLTRSDILKALTSGAAIQGYDTSAPTSDETLRDRVKRALRAQPWAPVANIRITASSGKILIEGVVGTEVIAQAVERLVQEVPGVIAVQNELMIEPYVAVGL